MYEYSFKTVSLPLKTFCLCEINTVLRHSLSKEEGRMGLFKTSFIYFDFFIEINILYKINMF